MKNLLSEIKPIKKQSLFGRIKSTFIYSLLAEVPPCEGHSSWTDWGTEYDCGYKLEVECQDCICCEDTGYLDPRTGQKFKKFRRYFA